MTQKTINAEDLFNLQFLQSGHFSANGEHIVYSVAHVDTEVDKEFFTIWRLSLATGEARAMTSGKAQDMGPQTSPDGQTIAFLSDRGKKPQLYTMPIDGGEPQQLTDIKQGVISGPVWSPDGSKIAFTAVPPFEGDSPPDLTKEVYRVTRNVYRFDAIGYLDQLVRNVYVVDVASKEVTRLTESINDHTALKWSPDGSKLMYLSGMHADSFIMMRNDISVVDMDGQVETFTDEQVGVQSADWTPDGRIIYLGRPMRGAPIGTKSDLWTLDTATGATESRMAEMIFGAGGSLSLRMPTRVMGNNRLLTTQDGSHGFVRVQEGGNLNLYRVALHGDERWEVVLGGEQTVSLLDVDLENGRLLLAKTDLNTPPDLYLTDLDGRNQKRLTNLNGDFLAERTLPETQHLLFQGQDGKQVEGWYMKPAGGGDGPHPTILYIHGGPHAAYGRGFAFDFQMLAGQGYGVLFINHRASTGYGDVFSTAIKGDWGNLDYGDLMAGVDYAIAQGLADGDRLGCCGTSGGGNLSCWIVGQTDRFKAAIPQNPVTNWVSFYGCSDIGVWFSVEQMGGHPHEIPNVYAKCSPITYAHRCTTPTLLVQSEHDWRCPAEQSEQFYTVLKANGCTVEMLRQPGGFHGASVRGAINLRREHLLAMLDWFEQYV